MIRIYMDLWIFIVILVVVAVAAYSAGRAKR